MSVQLDPPELGFRSMCPKQIVLRSVRLTESGPFTHEVTQLLRLSNPNGDPIAFKVISPMPFIFFVSMMLTGHNTTGQNHCSKTVCLRSNGRRLALTAALDIAFAPTLGASSLVTKSKCRVYQESCGLCREGSWRHFAVLLQAMREDPPPDARCRDKFLVQSVAITPDRELANITAIVSDFVRYIWVPAADTPQWQNIEKVAKGSIEERKIRVLFLPAEGSTATPTHNNVNGTVSDFSLNTT